MEDLALWERNFYDARVGGAGVIQQMLVRGRLNNGREISCASALVLGRHRGLPTVEHGGADAAYRSMALRFPEQRLSVVLLGNAGNLDTASLTRRVAEIYLQGTPGLAPPPSFAPEVVLPPGALSAYLGSCEMRPGFVLNFTDIQGQLHVQATGQPRFAMFVSAPDSFFTEAFEASVRFDAPAADGHAASATWRQGGSDLPLRRVLPHVPQPPEALQSCVGLYYSEELATLYELSMGHGQLQLRHPRGTFELKALADDLFAVEGFLGTMRLQRNTEKVCTGLVVNTGRLRQLKFQRVNLQPAQ